MAVYEANLVNVETLLEAGAEFDLSNQVSSMMRRVIDALLPSLLPRVDDAVC